MASFGGHLTTGLRLLAVSPRFAVLFALPFLEVLHASGDGVADDPVRHPNTYEEADEVALPSVPR